MTLFRLSIVTPEKVWLDSEVVSLTVPGQEGYLGVLANHAPLITALQPGAIEYRDSEDELNVLAVSGGFLEVSRNTATILADTVEKANDIDVERAREAHDRARKRLDSRITEEAQINFERAKAALMRAANRIKIYQTGR